MIARMRHRRPTQSRSGIGSARQAGAWKGVGEAAGPGPGQGVDPGLHGGEWLAQARP